MPGRSYDPITIDWRPDGDPMERDWLKHGGAAEMTIDRANAAFMIARAMSKLDQWTPKMDEFKIWLLSNLENL